MKTMSTRLAIYLLTALVVQSLFAADRPPLAKAPFSAGQAKALQKQWAAFLGRDVVETNAAGMRMVLIPPGVFNMGTPDAEMDALIQDIKNDPAMRRWVNWVIGHTLDRGTRQIKISKPFYIGETEVTVGQFRKFVEATGYKTYPLDHLPKRNVERAWFMWHIGMDADGESGLGLAVLAQKPQESWYHWTNRWATHGLNPLLPGPIKDPCVIRVNDGFRMWCVRPNDGKPRICYAESPDGVNWVEPARRAVPAAAKKPAFLFDLLPLGKDGEFDSHGHADPCVLAVGDQFFMWFLGSDGRKWRVGFATSPDGIHWTKSKDSPVLKGGNPKAWDAGSIHGLHVLREGDRFHIWYAATDGKSHEPQTMRIGYASSKVK